MAQKRFKTLFLCTGNSARSLFAEYLLRKAGGDRFEVFSAGVKPKPSPNPHTLEILRDDFDIDASEARSKSLDEFKDVEFDLIITVCDDAKESCPVWPGHPAVAHWTLEKPVDSEDDKSTHDSLWKLSQQINRRVELLAALPVEKLDKLRLEAEAHSIGQA